jgi:polysaccharide biosynthesis/export protein
LLKTIFVFTCCIFLAAASSPVQAAIPPTPQSSSEQPQQTQEPTGSSSETGQRPIQYPQNRVNPTQITNVSPAQEGRDQQKDSIGMGRPLPPLPPEPDLEFQEFVASSLGIKLSVFGQNLFQNVPSTFAPLDHVEVPADYIIGPGDELLIRTWGQIDVNWRAVVDRAGAIYIYKIGSFNVAGVRYEELHDYLQTEIGRIFKNFQLSVNLGRLRSIQIFIVGQARRPGTFTISSLSSLVDALFASGGPSKRGSMRRIQLKRAGKIVTTLDLYELIVNGDKSKDVTLMSGDVIYVPAVGPLVALAGSVNEAAVFELKGRSTLGEVIAYAGGLTNTSSAQNALVERIDAHHIRQTDEFALDQAGFARELHDGDVVRFLRLSPKFENVLSLRGNIAVPGHYPWHPGMRVHDLIPNREFLVTDEYWKRQNQLAVNAQAGDFRVNRTELKNDVKKASAEINWEYAVVQRLDPQELAPHLIPFNLAKAIEGNEADNLLLLPNDVITIFSQADIQVPIAQQSKFVHLEGELVRSGVYEVRPGETLRHLITRVGGFSPQAYLYGSEFTRESTRVSQQLRLDEYVNSLDKSLAQNSAAIASAGDAAEAAYAKIELESQRNIVEKMKGLRATGRVVLELKPNAQGPDALPDLVLEDGDRLLVPNRPATVGVIGSVYNSNAFISKPGKTVADYLRLAGGPTRFGDKGREFVIRADGSTVSRQQHNRLLSRDFNSLKLMPGDTIVVPEKLNRGATLRALREFTAIFAQLGIAGAGFRTIFP